MAGDDGVIPPNERLPVGPFAVTMWHSDPKQVDGLYMARFVVTITAEDGRSMNIFDDVLRFTLQGLYPGGRAR